MSFIFILGMVAYGLKRGAVPALRWALILGFTFLIAFTLRDAFAPMLHRIFRKADRQWIEAASYIVLEVAVFCALTVPMLMWAHETIPIRKQLDRALGLVFGVAGGLALSGLVVLTVMTLPFGRKMFTGGTDWYLPPHKLMLRVYNHLTRGTLGTGRPFVEEVVARDMELGRPKMPLGDPGLWVSSVPVGLRAYLLQGESYKTPQQWKLALEVQLPKNEEAAVRIEGTRHRRIEGYLGRTPVLVPVEVDQMLVAVERPVEGLSVDQGSPFYWDGEEGWFTQSVFRETVIVKMYRVQRQGDNSLISCVAAFIPRNMKDQEEMFTWYESKLPGRDCFNQALNDKEALEKLEKVTSTRAAEDHYVPWLRRGGKAVLEASDTGELVVMEVTPDRTLKVVRKPAGFEMPAIK